MSGAVATPRARGRAPRRRLVTGVLRRPASLAAVVYLVLLIVVSAGAPWLAPHDPNVQSLRDAFAPPGAAHLLGTDEFGRDVLSRIMHGARIALIAPAISLAAATLLGVPAGMWAGMRRGWLDTAAGRLVDTLLSLPGLVVALAVIAVVGPGLVNVMLAVGILFAPTLYRVTRGATMAVAEETFVESAAAIGCSTKRTIWVHVLPNISAPLLVQVTVLMGISLLLEASLSFLGLGVQPPDASWGAMLGSAYRNQYQAPLAVIPPGIALCGTVLAFNVIGDTVRDVMTGRRRA